ncbi:MAG TPA: hypothetical protein VGK31_03865 [Thermoanaerobaculia bacterium]
MFHARIPLIATLVVLCTVNVFGQAQIDTIEINQAIGVQKNNARKFVAGKDTVVRAFLAAPVEIDGAKTSAKITRDGETVTTLAPNSYDSPTAIVDFLCPSRDACGNWAAGKYTFDVSVNGVTKSTAGTTYDFVPRSAIRILALPVKANFGGNIVSVRDSKWKTFADYVRKTYPVGSDQLIWVTREELDASDSSFDLETEDGRLRLWEALAKLIPAECAGTPSADGCFAQVFGFINDRPMGYPNGRLQGYTYGKPANIGVATDEDAAATVAHEIGHTYGLGDTYDGGSLACAVNPAPDDFTGKDFDDPSKTAKCSSGKVALEGVSGTKIPASDHPYEVGGRGALADAAEYMGSGGRQDQFWTTQDAYDWLFDKLAPTAAGSERLHKLAAPQRFIQCFGLIRQNATSASDVKMEPCWSFLDTDPIPSTTGRYMLAAVDAAGTRLATDALTLTFDPVGSKGQPSQHIDFAPFASEMSFPEATTKLQLIRDGNVVLEIPVSAHAPVVSNVAPQLTGRVDGPITITWDASDADGNALTYEVEYNADVTSEDSDWEVLMRDLKDRRFTIDFSDMPGGSHSKIRVWATDGIHAAEADSLEFSVQAKPPEVFIEDLPSPVVQSGHEIVLDGDAFDLQDDDIPESKLQWRSNISGVLGNGTPLKVILPLGLHTITLAATNSLGLQGVATIKVNVVTETKRRAVRR